MLILNVSNVDMATPIRGQSVYAEVNALRAENKIPPLAPDPLLVKAAQAKADDMVKSGYFAHRSPEGKNMWSFIGHSANIIDAGENLAKGFSDTEKLTIAWMNSPTHRANILEKDFTKTGIALATDKNGVTHVVQLFGKTK